MARIVVIGGANVDIKGRVDGPFIAATSNAGRVTEAAGGVGRNIAHNLGLLGAAVSLIAPIGNDERGRFLSRATAGAGVDVSGLVVGKETTGAYLAILDGKGELLAAINDMAASEGFSPIDLEARTALIESASWLVADCNLPVACLAWLVGLARRHGLKLVIEPVSVAKGRRLLDLPDRRGIHAITPNRLQLAALTGREDLDEGLAALANLGFGRAVVHCGKDGAVAAEAGKRPQAIPALAGVEVADVTGAGDAAVAGLVFGLAEGFSFAAAARLGQAAAALKLRSNLSVAAGMSRATVLALAGPMESQ